MALPSDDPYTIPLGEKDPTKRLFESYFVMPQERREEEAKEREKSLDSLYSNMLKQLGNMTLPPTEEQLRGQAFDIAEHSYKSKGVTPTDEDLSEKADRWFEKMNRDLGHLRKTHHSQIEQMANKGLLSTKEDYVYTEGQRKSISEGSVWYLTEDQAKNRVLRHWSSKGMLPPNEYNRLLNSTIEQIRNDPKIRPELKLDLEEEHTQPRKGSLSKKEDIIEENLLQKIGSSWPMKTVMAPAEAVAGHSASYVNQWIRQGLAKDIVAEARPLKPEELAYIDSQFEEYGLKRRIVPKHTTESWDKTFGVVPDYMKRGWYPTRGELPHKWIDANTGLPYKRGEPNQVRATNPAYKEEVEFRKANKPPKQEPDAAYTTRPHRPMGVSPETFAKYDADAGTAIAQGVRAAYYDPRAPKLEDVLMRVRGSFEKASDVALRAIPLDSPMRERYYGADENDRADKALSMATDKYGEPISDEEYEAALEKERRSLGRLFMLEGIDDAQIAEIESEASQNVIGSFGGRLPEKQFMNAYNAIYQNYPHLKMMSDQLKLADPTGVANPQIATILHKVVLDPLWFTGPIRLAKGAQEIRAGWGVYTAKKLVSAGYGLAKEGKYGKTISNFARATDFVGTGVAEYGKDVALGAKELGLAVPGVKPTVGAYKTTYQWMTEKFSHFSKTGKDYDNLGDLKDDISLLSRVSADAGAGASQKLRSLGDNMLLELEKAGTAEERHILHLLLSGQWLNMYADSIEAGTKAWLDPKKASAAMQQVLANPKMDAAKQLSIMADEAVRTRYIRPELGEVVNNVRKLSDQFYDIAKEHGQLSKIEEGILAHAKYVPMYVPRWLKNTEKIHDDLVKLGFKDIGDAAYQLAPAGTQEIIGKIVGAGVKQTFEAAVHTIEGISKETGGFQAALRSKGLSFDEIDLFNKVVARREEVITLAMKQGITPEQYFKEIAAIKRALDNPDYLGQINLSAGRGVGERVRRKIAGKAAIERKPLGEKYYWLQDPLRQFEAYVRDVSSRARISGEIKELGRAFGVNKVASVLESPAMIRISGRGITGTVAERSKKITQIEELLTANHGLEMVALSPGVSKEVAKVLLQEGAKITDEAVAFVPKVVANRLDNLLHIVPLNQQGDLYRYVKNFRDYAVKPMNTIYRTTRTVLRSPAFHAVNYFGAVGLGGLGLGVDALNPGLQRGAHKMAVSAAFGGSDVARGLKMALPRSTTGEVIKLGDGFKIMEDYGALNQGMMKYGLDMAAGKGLLSIPANMLSATAKKWRAQQVAEFADNYQKAVLFLGHLKSTKRIDIYRTLDFVAEYGQNYNRLTDFERTVMRDIFTFYSWNRFILPHLVRQVYKNPTRLAAFEKIKEVIEYNNKDQAPISGMALPAFLWMQGATTAPAHLQPKPGEAAPHEYGMQVMEMPFSSSSIFAGGFHGESAVHAQLGAVPRALMSVITGFDYGSGHKWEKRIVMPTLDDFDSLDAAKDYLYRFNDSRVGRLAVETVPMGAAFLNCIKLYSKEGMHSEASELYMRYRCGRDFMGIDNAIAEAMGMKGLSIPATVKVGGLKVPAPWIRLYPVTGTKESQRRARKF